MLGETVAVLSRTEGEPDAMGEPAYTWSAELVDNCLVRPMTGGDLADAQRPDGVEVKYTIAFPKGYTGDLAHARIALVSRGADVSDPAAAAKEALHVTGSPDITQPCPTAWNRLVEAGVVNG